MHFHDLLGDGQPEAGAAFLLGVGIVDLVELFEDAGELIGWDAGPGVGDRHREVAVLGFCRDAHLAGVGELDGVADQVKQHLGQSLLVAEANR